MADPVTLTALGTAAAGAGALGSLGLGIFGGKGGSTTPPAPTAAPPPAPPIQQPSGTPGGAAAAAGATGPGTSSPSFVGSSSLPQQQGYGTKTLLGQ